MGTGARQERRDGREIVRGAQVEQQCGTRVGPGGVSSFGQQGQDLESRSNPYGFMNLVDPYVGGAFNPSILVLPDQAGLGWRHVFVSRGEEKYEVIQGEDTRWEKLIGCFL